MMDGEAVGAHPITPRSRVDESLNPRLKTGDALKVYLSSGVDRERPGRIRPFRSTRLPLPAESVGFDRSTPWRSVRPGPTVPIARPGRPLFTDHPKIFIESQT